MRGGHLIKSVAEKKAAGTSQKCRDEGRLELSAKTVSHLPPPSHFTKKHVEKWDWLCSRLKEKNILTESDSDTIQVYVENWVLYEECVAEVRANGTTLWVENAAGKKPITNPAYRHMKDCETIMRMIWDHFGMTPRARMGIKATPEKPKTSSILELMKPAVKKIG